LAKADAVYADIMTRTKVAFTHGEWDVGHFAFDYGELLLQEGKLAPAREMLRTSVAVLRRSLGADNERTRAAVAALGQAGDSAN
jgi:hypothetical protein